MIRLFEGALHAQSYAKFRPVYPQDVVDRILGYCREAKCDNQRALDVGCGSGQSSEMFAAHFKEVIGIDPSPAQIQSVSSKSENVTYKVGSAENLLDVCGKNSVDLVTCAQAFHWIEGDKFFQQCRNVLKPNGVLAVYGYGNVKLNSDDANKIIWKFYRNTLHGYWDGKRVHIDEHYAQFTLPFKDFKRIDDVSMKKQLSLKDFIGYVSTWSAYQGYMKAKPDAVILEDLCKELHQVFSTGQVSAPSIESLLVEAVWPVFILLGHN